MEESLDNKTLGASQPINGDDSALQSHQTVPETSILPSTEDIVPVEKRKREDSESMDPNPNPNPEEEPSLHPLWKTSLCSYFRRHGGACSHGSACRYAHGEEELRPRPDNTWDPTSDRAKKAMKLETGEKCIVSESVMMTEVIVDEEDANDNDGSNQAFTKCLVHLPRKWSSEILRNFLNEQASELSFMSLAILEISFPGILLFISASIESEQSCSVYNISFC